MRLSRFYRWAAGLMIAVLPVASGCHWGWHRADFVTGAGAIAAALLLQAVPGLSGLLGINVNTNNDGDTGDDGAGQTIPTVGEQGEQGIPGINGTDGVDGTNGTNGTNGTDGVDGATGPQGPAGPTLFDVFVEDFYGRDGTRDASLAVEPTEINPVLLTEPALGVPDLDTGEIRAIAFRFAIPQSYDGVNPVTIRLFLYRTGSHNTNFCFAFRIDARRLADGSSISDYGTPMYFRPDVSATGDELLVIDLPINTATGLNYPSDLVQGQLLAFEFNTISPPQEGGLYQVLGAEIYESELATPPSVAGGTLSTTDTGTGCVVSD